MSIDDGVNDLLTGSGIATAKFSTIGTLHKGTIVAAKKRQQTEMGTGKPLTFDDGQPRMEVLIDLQTDERDPAVEDDDGLRRVYARGQMLKAIGEACRKAGAARGIEVGGQLALQAGRHSHPARRHRLSGLTVTMAADRLAGAMVTDVQPAFVTIEVFGTPAPAGSKTVVPTAAGPRPVDGGSKTARAARGVWRFDVVNATRAVMGGSWRPMTGPIRLRIIFYVARPKTLPKVRRNGYVPKPITRPDATKLLRAVEDALTTAGLWVDDNQVTSLTVTKRFADERPPGAFIMVAELDRLTYDDGEDDGEPSP
jgi:Holliday junction resolvase RusA-like endonuclease